MRARVIWCWMRALSIQRTIAIIVRLERNDLGRASVARGCRCSQCDVGLIGGDWGPPYSKRGAAPEAVWTPEQAATGAYRLAPALALNRETLQGE